MEKRVAQQEMLRREREGARRLSNLLTSNELLPFSAAILTLKGGEQRDRVEAVFLAARTSQIIGNSIEGAVA